MSFFEFPHTRTYDTDLGWIIKHLGELITETNTLQAWAAEHKEEYEELKDKVDGLINNLVDVIVPWDSSIAYHVFSIVEYQGTNYIAVQDVPIGTMITNTDYWQPANTVVEQINAMGTIVSDLQEDYQELSNSQIWRSITSYGAVGDGETDDTTAIQNAINDATTNNYCLYVPKGTFKVTGLVAKDGMVLYGDNERESVIYFDQGSFTGDPDNHNMFNGGEIRNLTIKGNSEETEQAGFKMIMLSSIIDHVQADGFTGVGFDMERPENPWYQEYVNHGENHGLMNCSAHNCKIGFRLYTWDGVYNNLIAGLCDTGIICASCKISGLHIWGFKEVGLRIEGVSLITNAEVEASLVETPPGGAVTFYQCEKVNISNFYIWNIRITSRLLWFSAAKNVNITNLVVGDPGTLTSADRVLRLVGGTGDMINISGSVADGFSGTGGYVGSVTGTNNEITITSPYAGTAIDGVIHHEEQSKAASIYELTKDVEYSGGNDGAYNLGVSPSYLIGAVVLGQTANYEVKVFTYNSSYFFRIININTGANAPAGTYSIKSRYIYN